MSWFKRLFHKEKPMEPVDLGRLEVDFHSHLIAGVDDGAETIEQAVELVKGLHAFGYRKIITTPHVMNDFYRNTPEIILGGLEKLKVAVKEAGLNVELEAAAEYYLDDGFEKKLENGELLSFGDNHVLFELPFIAEPPMFNRAIFEMLASGYKPILAHPERYGFWYSNLDKYAEIKEKGVALQLNILSLSGHYSPETKKVAEHLIDEGLIDFLGSDCHNVRHLHMIEVNLGRKYLHKLLDSGKLKNGTL